MLESLSDLGVEWSKMQQVIPSLRITYVSWSLAKLTILGIEVESRGREERIEAKATYNKCKLGNGFDAT
jgi:hypothetical protein